MTRLPRACRFLAVSVMNQEETCESMLKAARAIREGMARHKALSRLDMMPHVHVRLSMVKHEGRVVEWQTLGT